MVAGQIRFCQSQDVRGRPGGSSATSGKRPTAARNGRSNKGSSERDRVRRGATEAAVFYGFLCRGWAVESPKTRLKKDTEAGLIETYGLPALKKKKHSQILAIGARPYGII